MPSLANLKKKKDEPASTINDSDDDEKKSTNSVDSSSKQTDKKKKASKNNDSDNDSDNQNETTPKKAGRFDRFKRTPSKKDSNDDDNKSEKSEKSDEITKSPSRFSKPKLPFGRKKAKQEDSDDEQKQDSDENDENNDDSNKPQKEKKKKSRKKKGDSDDEDDGQEQQMMEGNVQHVGFLRKAPKEKLEKRLRERVRIVAESLPEVHFMGEVIGGTGFSAGVSCKWTIEFGKYWELLSGEYSGQSQFSYSDPNDLTSFNHPLDVHFAASSIQGWPRMKFQVWELDEYGRTNLTGYGFCHLPTNIGSYEITVPCWRPTGSMPEEIQSFFLGANPQLTNEDVLFSKAWENRCRLVTIPSGKVHIQMNVIHRFLEDQQIDNARG